MRTFFVLTFISAACTLHAGDLYIVPSAGAACVCDGTARRPFTSLAQARDAIRAAKQAGDVGAWTVHVRKGTYALTEPFVLEPCDSGSPGAPVTYAGEGPDTCVAGGFRIDGWEEVPEGYWSADIPLRPDGERAYFESLFVNGRRAVRARHPNSGFFTPQALKQTLLTNAAQRAEYAAAALTGRPVELAPLAGSPKGELRYAQVVVHHNWDTTRRMILDFDAATGTLLTQGARWKPWNPWRTNSLYYVENVRAAFDAPGEWFYDGCRGKILYRPRTGERLPGAEVFAPVPGLQTLVVFKGDPDATNFVRHILFRDMAFRYTDSPRRGRPGR